MVLEWNQYINANKHSTLSRSCPVKALDSIERSSRAKRWRSTYDDGAKGWRCCTVLWSRQSQCCFFCLRILRHAKGHVGPNLIQFADSIPSHPVMKSFEPALWPSLLIWLTVGKVPMQMPMVFVQVPMQPQQQVVPMMQKGREQLLAEATVENFILCVCESLCECVFVCLCLYDLYVSVSLFLPIILEPYLVHSGSKFHGSSCSSFVLYQIRTLRRHFELCPAGKSSSPSITLMSELLPQ